MMTKEFVPFEIATLLKEINFDENCFAYFKVGSEHIEHFLPPNSDESFGSLNQNSIDGLVSRPLWQQVFRWFRERHNFSFEIYEFPNKSNQWNWKLSDGTEQKVQNRGEGSSELEVQITAIKRAIEKIKDPSGFEETQHQQMMRLMEEHFNSGESDKYFEKIRIKQEAKDKRFLKFQQYLLTHSFDELLQRLIDENGDAHREKCYKKGYQPYPTNLMQFVYDYVKEYGEEQEIGSIDDNPFESEAYHFKGYYFQLFCGQGCVIRVFNSQKEEILTI